LTALLFAFAGSTPLPLLAVPLAGHLLVVGLTFTVLQRELRRGTAFVLTLPLVLAPHPFNVVSLYPPRQWAITCVFAAVWLLARADRSRQPQLHYFLAALLSVLSLYLDLFAVLFTPALGLLAISCIIHRDGGRGRMLGRFGAWIAGVAIGGAALWAVRQLVPAGMQFTKSPQLSWQSVGDNARLFWQGCFPWILSDSVFIPGEGGFQLDDRWEPPVAFRAIQRLGAVTLVAGITLGGIACGARQVPWQVRRLGMFGFAVAACTIAGFLASPDTPTTGLWATRFLTPIIWAAPFALAPVAYLAGTKRLALGIAPYLVAAAVGGWLGFGPYVRGPAIVHSPHGVAAEEAQLGALLRQRGIDYAAADYWLAYRLTFLWGEEPIVIPLIPPGGERYLPYQRGFDGATEVAYIFHPYAQRTEPASYARGLAEAGIRYEQQHVGDFTILIFHKRACEPLAGHPSTC
jgi:hypothetical protein